MRVFSMALIAFAALTQARPKDRASLKHPATRAGEYRG
jgi:hypothetical protein